MVGTMNKHQLGYALGFLLEIMKRTLTRKYRGAIARKVEQKITWGVRLGFTRKFSVGPELREVEG